MRVVCDSCAATYKIPDEKLRKAVNKATCRKCGHRMLIRRDDAAGTAGPALPPAKRVVGTESEEENPWADEGPTQIQPSPLDSIPKRPAPATPPPSVPKPVVEAAPKPAPTQPTPPTPPTPRSPRPPMPQAAGTVHRSDMSGIFFGCLVATAGSTAIAAGITLDDPLRSFVQAGGTAACLAGSLTGLFILFTGHNGKRKASLVLSLFLSLVVGLAGGGISYFLEMDRDERDSEEIDPDLLDFATTLTPEEIDQLVEQREAASEEEDEEGTDEEGTDEEGTDEDEEGADEEGADEDESEGPNDANSSQTDRSNSRSEPSENSSTSSRSSSASDNSSSSTSERNSDTTRNEPRDEEDEEEDNGSSYSSTTSRSTSNGSGSSDNTATDAREDVAGIQVRNNQAVQQCIPWFEQRDDTIVDEPLNLRIVVAPTGSVSTVTLSNSSFGGTALEACMSIRVKEIQFTAFEGSSEIYRVQITPD